MFKFSSEEAKASKVIEYGTNLTCLKGRAIVCKAKKTFSMSYDDDNFLVVEAGDIVAVGYSDFGSSKKSHCVRIAGKQYLKNLSSKDFIEAPDGWWRFTAKFTLKEFRECLEPLDDETEQLESCICTAEIKKANTDVFKEKIRNAEDFYADKAESRQKFVGLVSMLAAVAAGVLDFGYLRHCGVLLWCVAFAVILGLLIFGLAAFLAADCNGAEEIFEVRNKVKVEEAQKEYDKELTEAAEALDRYRKSVNWL